MDVIETTDLTKIYQNRYIALNAMNMRVEKGMVYGYGERNKSSEWFNERQRIN